MEKQTVSFNAENWVTGEDSVTYYTFKDGHVKFAYRGKNWILSPEVPDGHGFSSTRRLYLAEKTMSEFPYVKMCRYGKDPAWTATDDDYINGITREDRDPVVAACKILANIL